MGNQCRTNWTEELIVKELKKIVEGLGLENFPTKRQMIDFFGNNALANKVSRTGGSRYYASLLNLNIGSSESEFGNFYEEFAIDEIFEKTGFLSTHTNVRYPYDLLTNGNIKVDVKASAQIKGENSKFCKYSFNLEKREPTCDIFVFYCLDENMKPKKSIVIPSCILAGKTQLGVGELSRWDAYIDRWEYFGIYNDFYDSVKKTAIVLPKRRSK